MLWILRPGDSGPPLISLEGEFWKLFRRFHLARAFLHDHGVAVLVVDALIPFQNEVERDDQWLRG